MMKTMICALALAGLFTSQANAYYSDEGTLDMSCGQLSAAKADTLKEIKTVVAKIKKSTNGDTTAYLKTELADLFMTAKGLEATIQDRCMGDDYND